ncbi:MAG TPA: inorganic diphosphatase [Actinomycetota bacterium]|nr:inorganic diphosphatase [Actinomycetota bacterium]
MAIVPPSDSRLIVARFMTRRPPSMTRRSAHALRHQHNRDVIQLEVLLHEPNKLRRGRRFSEPAGDPLVALVLVGEPSFPGCRIVARPVGVFRMRDGKGQDDQILCVPVRDSAPSHVLGLDDLRPTCSPRSNTSSRSTRTWKTRRWRPTASGVSRPRC